MEKFVGDEQTGAADFIKFDADLDQDQGPKWKDRCTAFEKVLRDIKLLSCQLWFPTSLPDLDAFFEYMLAMMTAPSKIRDIMKDAGNEKTAAALQHLLWSTTAQKPELGLSHDEAERLMSFHQRILASGLQDKLRTTLCSSVGEHVDLIKGAVIGFFSPNDKEIRNLGPGGEEDAALSVALQGLAKVADHIPQVLKAAVKLGDTQLQAQVQLLEVVSKCVASTAHVTKIGNAVGTDKKTVIVAMGVLAKDIAQLAAVVAVRSGAMRSNIVFGATTMSKSYS